MASIGERLRGYRDSLGLTQRQAAESAGITQHSWCMFERDERVPRVGAALALARLTKDTPYRIRLRDFAEAERARDELRRAS